MINESISDLEMIKALQAKNKVLQKELDLIRMENQQLKADPQNQLIEISKKLSKVLKKSGEDEMIAQLALDRAKVLDHFTLAYMGDLKLRPSEVKLVQGFNADGYFEMFFEKNSKIITDL